MRISDWSSDVFSADLWVATCPSCSKRYSKHRKPKAPTGGRFYYCPPCWKGLSYLPKAERAKLSELTFVDTVSPVVATMPQKRVSAPVSASQAAPSVSEIGRAHV